MCIEELAVLLNRAVLLDNDLDLDVERRSFSPIKNLFYFRKEIQNQLLLSKIFNKF